MNKLARCILMVWLMVSGVGAWAASPGLTAVEKLWLFPAGDAIFLVEQTVEAGQPVLRIGFQKGSDGVLWDKRMGRAGSVVALEDTLYIAYDTGAVVRDAGPTPQIFLPRLPESAVLERLVADLRQNRLFALVREPKSTILGMTTTTATQPAAQNVGGHFRHVYEQVVGTWKTFLFLPTELESGPVPDLLADNGRFDLFAKKDKSLIRHWQFRNQSWVRQPDLKPGVEIRDFRVFSLDGLPLLLVASKSGRGVALHVYRVRADGQVAETIPLNVGNQPLILSGLYGLGAGTGQLAVGYLDPDQRQIQVARWTTDGKPAGSLQAISRTPPQGQQGHSILMGLLLGALILAVFFTRGVARPEEKTLPAGWVIAMLWRRALAFIFDILLISFVFFFVLSLFWLDEYREMVMQSDFYHRWVTGQIDTKWYIIGLTFPAIFTGYGVLMEGFFGWTVGKWMLRLQVRRANQMGEKAGWPQVILRNVIKILELNFAPVLLVMGINRSHQRLGDMLAGTVVLQEQKRFDNYS